MVTNDQVIGINISIKDTSKSLHILLIFMTKNCVNFERITTKQ